MGIWVNPKKKSYTSTGPTAWLKRYVEFAVEALQAEIREKLKTFPIQKSGVKGGAAISDVRERTYDDAGNPITGNEASGTNALAAGTCTTAIGDSQLVHGRYNLPEQDALHIVGNGSAENPSNAYVLDNNGNGWFGGKVSVGQECLELATKAWSEEMLKNGLKAIDGLEDELTQKADITWIDIESKWVSLAGWYPVEVDSLIESGLYGLKCAWGNEYLIATTWQKSIIQTYIGSSVGIRVRSGNKHSDNSVSWNDWQEYVKQTQLEDKADITWLEIESELTEAGYPIELDSVVEEGFYGLKRGFYDDPFIWSSNEYDFVCNEYLIVSRVGKHISQMYLDATNGIRVRTSSKGTLTEGTLTGNISIGNRVDWDDWKEYATKDAIPIQDMSGAEVEISSGEMVTAEEGATVIGDVRERTYDENGKITAGNVAAGKHSLALGRYNTATGNTAIASGSRTTASGDSSIATGYKTESKGEYSVAMGYNTVAEGKHSIATGNEASATGEYSVAMGSDAVSSGQASLAFGMDSKATAHGAVAIGPHCESKNTWAIAIGHSNQATGEKSIATGYKTESKGEYSVAMGYNTVAARDHSIATGYKTESKGVYSVAMGSEAVSSGQASLAFGMNSKATASGAVAIGPNCEATDTGTIAIGHSNQATGSCSVALGYLSKAQADYAIALGGHNTASSIYSFATGYEAKAQGDSSAAFGKFTIANGETQFVTGKWNVADTTALHIVGNGSEGARSNAYILDKDGNGWFAGDITANIDIDNQIKSVSIGDLFEEIQLLKDRVAELESVNQGLESIIEMQEDLIGGEEA